MAMDCSKIGRPHRAHRRGPERYLGRKDESLRLPGPLRCSELISSQHFIYKLLRFLVIGFNPTKACKLGLIGEERDIQNREFFLATDLTLGRNREAQELVHLCL